MIDLALKPLKILMLVDKFPPSYSGHTMQVLKMSNQIVTNPLINVVFLTPRVKKESKNEIWASFQVRRFRIINTKIFGNFFYSISGFLCFVKYYGKVDVVHFQCLIKPLLFIALLIRFFYRKPVVGTMTLTGSDDIESFIKRNGSFYKNILNRVHMVSISNKLTAIYKSYYPDYKKLWQIPIGVNTKLFNKIGESDKSLLRNKLKLDSGAFIVIFTGIMNERKGAHFAIMVFQAFHKMHPDSILIMAGPYDYKIKGMDLNESYVENLFQNSQKLRNSGKIKFFGDVKNIHEYIQVADAFLFTSNNEGLPNVLLEYSSSGLPGVATFLDGITEMVIENDVNGYIVNGRELKKFIEKLEVLYNNHELRNKMGSISREKCEQLFSIEVIAEKTIKMYRSLLKNRSI